MKNLSATIFLLLLLIGARAQSSLFDDSRVSAIYIELSPDSLNVIMGEVLSDHYFQSRFIFDNGTNRVGEA